MELQEFWAKTDPFQSVPTHAVISGRLAQILLEELLSDSGRRLLCRVLCLDSEELTGFVGYLVSLHDIGKLEYSFQVKYDGILQKLSAEAKLAGLNHPGIRHEKTGRDCLRTIWRSAGEDRTAADLMAKIIGAHHQGKTGDGNYKSGSAWAELQTGLEAQMRKRFLSDAESVLPTVHKPEQGVIATLLLGLTILSDWIASGSVFANAEEWINGPDAEYRLQTAATAFLDRSELKPCRFQWPDRFPEFWPNIPRIGMRPMQTEIERICRECPDARLILIEAPMGEGKTEAGVYAAMQMARALGKDGLYLALPTAATSNQMVGRIRTLLAMHDRASSVRLLHSMAWLEQPEEQVDSPDEKDEISAWLAPAKRALLGQYSVGTVDQAMLAATNVKYGVLRLLGLSNKALLIDEIHSYDAYMAEIILRLLEWCRALEIPVVMLSATLPPLMKEKLLAPYTAQHLSGDYPLITAVDYDGRVTEHIIPETSHRMGLSVRFSPILGDAEQIAQLALKKTETGGCLCVLMNTVREAQEVYCAIRRQDPEDLHLFHAQFPAGQRAEIGTACIRLYGKDKQHRPRRSILVATQVVEQSLDVDFDQMITAVAPVDLLLQRAGRVFRHEDTPRPPDCGGAVLTVLVPPEGHGFGASSFVYPECLLRSAIRVLEARPQLRIPEDLAALVREGYDPALAPEAEAMQWMETQLKQQVEAGASRQYLLDPPDKLFAALRELVPYEDDAEAYQLSAKTRLGEPTVRIALLPPEELAQLEPFLQQRNGQRIAAVGDRETAERVMRLSVSVRLRRLGGALSGLSDIKGAKLLSGLRILPTTNGSLRAEDGTEIFFDPELGLQIKEGET